MSSTPSKQQRQPAGADAGAAADAVLLEVMEQLASSKLRYEDIIHGLKMERTGLLHNASEQKALIAAQDERMAMMQSQANDLAWKVEEQRRLLSGGEAEDLAEAKAFAEAMRRERLDALDEAEGLRATVALLQEQLRSRGSVVDVGHLQRTNEALAQQLEAQQADLRALQSAAEAARAETYSAEERARRAEAGLDTAAGGVRDEVASLSAKLAVQRDSSAREAAQLRAAASEFEARCDGLRQALGRAEGDAHAAREGAAGAWEAAARAEARFAGLEADVEHARGETAVWAHRAAVAEGELAARTSTEGGSVVRVGATLAAAVSLQADTTHALDVTATSRAPQVAPVVARLIARGEEDGKLAASTAFAGRGAYSRARAQAGDLRRSMGVLTTSELAQFAHLAQSSGAQAAPLPPADLVALQAELAQAQQALADAQAALNDTQSVMLAEHVATTTALQSRVAEAEVQLAAAQEQLAALTADRDAALEKWAAYSEDLKVGANNFAAEATVRLEAAEARAAEADAALQQERLGSYELSARLQDQEGARAELLATTQARASAADMEAAMLASRQQLASVEVELQGRVGEMGRLLEDERMRGQLLEAALEQARAEVAAAETKAADAERDRAAYEQSYDEVQEALNASAATEQVLREQAEAAGGRERGYEMALAEAEGEAMALRHELAASREERAARSPTTPGPTADQLELRSLRAALSDARTVAAAEAARTADLTAQLESAEQQLIALTVGPSPVDEELRSLRDALEYAQQVSASEAARAADLFDRLAAADQLLASRDESTGIAVISQSVEDAELHSLRDALDDARLAKAGATARATDLAARLLTAEAALVGARTAAVESAATVAALQSELAMTRASADGKLGTLQASASAAGAALAAVSGEVERIRAEAQAAVEAETARVVEELTQEHAAALSVAVEGACKAEAAVRAECAEAVAVVSALRSQCSELQLSLAASDRRQASMALRAAESGESAAEVESRLRGALERASVVEAELATAVAARESAASGVAHAMDVLTRERQVMKERVGLLQANVAAQAAALRAEVAAVAARAREDVETAAAATRRAGHEEGYEEGLKAGAASIRSHTEQDVEARVAARVAAASSSVGAAGNVAGESALRMAEEAVARSVASVRAEYESALETRLREERAKRGRDREEYEARGRRRAAREAEAEASAVREAHTATCSALKQAHGNELAALRAELSTARGSLASVQEELATAALSRTLQEAAGAARDAAMQGAEALRYNLEAVAGDLQAEVARLQSELEAASSALEFQSYDAQRASAGAAAAFESAASLSTRVQELEVEIVRLGEASVRDPHAEREAREAGYREGAAAGEAEGRAEAKTEAEASYRSGYNAGYEAAVAAGEASSRAAYEGRQALDASYRDGFEAGETEGRVAGRSAALADAEEREREEAVAAAEEADMSRATEADSAADMPAVDYLLAAEEGTNRAPDGASAPLSPSPRPRARSTGAVSIGGTEVVAFDGWGVGEGEGLAEVDPEDPGRAMLLADLEAQLAAAQVALSNALAQLEAVQLSLAVATDELASARARAEVAEGTVEALSAALERASTAAEARAPLLQSQLEAAITEADELRLRLRERGEEAAVKLAPDDSSALSAMQAEVDRLTAALADSEERAGELAASLRLAEFRSSPSPLARGGPFSRAVGPEEEAAATRASPVSSRGAAALEQALEQVQSELLVALADRETAEAELRALKKGGSPVRGAPAPVVPGTPAFTSALTSLTPLERSFVASRMLSQSLELGAPICSCGEEGEGLGMALPALPDPVHDSDVLRLLLGQLIDQDTQIARMRAGGVAAHPSVPRTVRSLAADLESEAAPVMAVAPPFEEALGVGAEDPDATAVIESRKVEGEGEVLPPLPNPLTGPLPRPLSTVHAEEWAALARAALPHPSTALASHLLHGWLVYRTARILDAPLHYGVPTAEDAVVWATSMRDWLEEELEGGGGAPLLAALVEGELASWYGNERVAEEEAAYEVSEAALIAVIEAIEEAEVAEEEEEREFLSIADAAAVPLTVESAPPSPERAEEPSSVVEGGEAPSILSPLDLPTRLALLEAQATALDAAYEEAVAATDAQYAEHEPVCIANDAEGAEEGGAPGTSLSALVRWREEQAGALEVEYRAARGAMEAEYAALSTPVPASVLLEGEEEEPRPPTPAWPSRAAYAAYLTHRAAARVEGGEEEAEAEAWRADAYAQWCAGEGAGLPEEPEAGAWVQEEEVEAFAPTPAVDPPLQLEPALVASALVRADSIASLSSRASSVVRGGGGMSAGVGPTLKGERRHDSRVTSRRGSFVAPSSAEAPAAEAAPPPPAPPSFFAPVPRGGTDTPSPPPPTPYGSDTASFSPLPRTGAIQRVASSLRPRYAVLSAEELAVERARAPPPTGWMGGLAGLFGRGSGGAGVAPVGATLDPDRPPPVAHPSLTLVDVDGAEFPAEVMTGGQWEALGEGGQASYLAYLSSLGIAT